MMDWLLKWFSKIEKTENKIVFPADISNNVADPLTIS